MAPERTNWFENQVTLFFFFFSSSEQLARFPIGKTQALTQNTGAQPNLKVTSLSELGQSLPGSTSLCHMVRTAECLPHQPLKR